jgi:hypothetical protein
LRTFSILSISVICFSAFSPGSDKLFPVKVLSDTLKITKVPASLGLDTFYKKYIDADGVPIISSGKVPDVAVLAARQIIIHMLSDIKVAGVVKYLNKYKVRVAVMAQNEVTTNIPEHKDLNKVFPKTNWDTRGRGFGATIARPATSCAEENLLCYPNDPYKGECILVHEFGHTIHQMALRFIDLNFDEKLKSIYESAKQKGLWINTYAISNYDEYWAEGLQCYFNTNLQAIPTNGIHNNINTIEELRNYDPDLFRFISAYFIDDDRQIGCYPPN